MKTFTEWLTNEAGAMENPGFNELPNDVIDYNVKNNGDGTFSVTIMFRNGKSQVLQAVSREQLKDILSS